MPLVALLASDGLIGSTVRHAFAEQGLQSLDVRTPRDFLKLSGSTQPTLAVAMLELLDDPPSLCRGLLPSGIPLFLLASSPLAPFEEAGHLRSGADDILAAPFHPEVFLARVEALLRRAARWPATRRLGHDGIVVDLDDRIAWVDGKTLPLTRTEFDLLAALMSRPLHIQPHSVLAETIGLRTETAQVAPHLSRLRRKVAAAGGPRIGKPVHGMGLRLAGESQSTTATPDATAASPDGAHAPASSRSGHSSGSLSRGGFA